MSKLTIDEELIRKLADLLHDTGLGEIEYEDGGRRLRLVRASQSGAASLVLPVQAAPTASAAAAAAIAPPADDASHPGAVKSPMVGTAYLSPEPGKPPFVSIGDKVSVGATLLIIEAMKTFNPIKATKAGTVTKIAIGNAQAVEFGEVLMVVD